MHTREKHLQQISKRGFRSFSEFIDFVNFQKTVNGWFPVVFENKKIISLNSVKWYIKWLLLFLKREYVKDEISRQTIAYKRYGDNVYLIDSFISPPVGYNCRHELIKS